VTRRADVFFNVVNVALFNDRFDRNFALQIAGRRQAIDELTTDIFRQFGRDVGLTGPLIDFALADLRRGIRRAAKVIQPPAAEPPDGFLHRFQAIVENACLRLLP
jgi:serine/threonine-protein kinase HipA